MDGHGVPLSIIVTGASRHDVTQLELVLDEIVIARPFDVEQHLCAEKGYSGKPALKAITETYLALLYMAAAIIAFRKIVVICG